MVDGRYFFPHSARFVEARAVLTADRRLHIEDRAQAMLADLPFKDVRVSARLGNIARRLTLPDGACFETYDNDGIDDMLADARRISGQGFVDRLERSWRTVAVSVLLAGLAGWGFVVFGIPAIAMGLAQSTPPVVARVMSDQTLAIIDRSSLEPSKLSPSDMKRADMLFERVASYAPRGRGGYALLFRSGKAIGPNAFALPDGRIVMTDQLWKLVKNDDEIEGVFAHEMSHVDHAHGLQRVYEASLIPAAIAVVTGDLSQVSQLSVILPGILLQSAYSRGFEQQADDDAAARLTRMGGHPARFAAFLERLDARLCGKSGCGPSWLGDHPDTKLRAERLRSEEPAKK
jgi:Zn-dependent protease with chaperone function